jgi:hypothetical protein
MNFSGNFSFIGNIEISELRKLVLSLTDEQWDDFSIRQNLYEVHQNTKAIGLVYDLDFRHSHPTRLPTLAMFEEALRPVLMKTAAHYEVKLMAGRDIAAHRDMNFSLTHSHRVHLPIITNDEVWFTVGKESINMREGDLYEVNNRRIHSVVNKGTEDRVHLILDFVLPGEQCCCGALHHPNTRCSPQACLDTVLLKVECNCHPEQ